MVKSSDKNYSSIKTLNVDDQDYETFNNKAGNNALFVNYAYAGSDLEMGELAKNLPENYQILLTTNNLDDTDLHSYKAAIFVNYEQKEIVCAVAGTRPGFNKEGFDDIYDDYRLAKYLEPLKMESANTLNDIILDSLGDEVENFSIHYTGHSLGAAVAEMQAADMDIKMHNRGLNSANISSVTFENPGTKPVIENIYKKNNLPKERASKLNSIIINNRANIINQGNPQMGKVYEIIPSKQRERKHETIIPEQISMIIAQYMPKLSWLVNQISTLIVTGGLRETVKEHSMDNFVDVFVKKEGVVVNRASQEVILTAQELATNIEPIEYDKEVFSSLNKLKQSNGNVGKQQYSMRCFDETTQAMAMVSFSEQELSKISSVSQTIPTKQKLSFAERHKKEQLTRESPKKDGQEPNLRTIDNLKARGQGKSSG